MKKLTLASLAVSLLAALASTANATVIDFNSNSTQAYFVPNVQSNGFTFVGNPQADKNIGTSNDFDFRGQSNGTVYFTAWSNSSSATLVDFYATDLHLFSLQSFQFDNAYSEPGGIFGYTNSRTHSLTVIGTHADNSTVSQTFTDLGGVINTFVQLQLSAAFQNLKSVRIDVNGDSNVRALFDNFTVDAHVPDSGATVALLGLGVMALAGVRRKLVC